MFDDDKKDFFPQVQKSIHPHRDPWIHSMDDLKVISHNHHILRLLHRTGHSGISGCKSILRRINYILRRDRILDIPLKILFIDIALFLYLNKQLIFFLFLQTPCSVLFFKT